MKNKFQITFFLIFSLLLFSSCENIDDSNSISDESFNVIELIDISQLKINSDTINIQNGKNSDDTVSIQISLKFLERLTTNSSQEIESFHFQIINTDNSENEFSSKFSTNKMPLQNQSSILHSGTIDYKIKRKNIGNYILKIYGTKANKRISNYIITNVIIYRENHNPVIEAVFAPDTIYISEGTQKYKLIAKVYDQDGLEDIKKVFFNSYKPDGSPAAGNPFQMYDDGDKNGLSGDDKAFDGLYSLNIQISQQNPKGRYRFEFYALDKSDSLSTVYKHYIIVK